MKNVTFFTDFFKKTTVREDTKLNDAALSSTQHVVFQTYGFSLRQALQAVLIIMVVGVLMLYVGQDAWLALFFMLVTTLCAVALLMMTSQKFLPICRHWMFVWLLFFVLTIVFSILSTGTYWAVTKHFLMARPPVATCMLVNLFFTMLCLGLPLSINHTRSHAFHIANLKSLALVAELNALQAQIEPHFLYNTLSNTRYLARHDSVKAVQMLDHLISYLQSALPDLRQQHSTVKREFDMATHYLAIMAIRFGERLQYQVDFDEDLGAVAMPPLMLMTLVENAIQHGVEPKPGTVTVTVTGRRKNKQLLQVLVSDDGVGLNQKILGTGVGLRNLRERLHGHFGSAAEFHLRRTDKHLTEAELILPTRNAIPERNS